MTDINMICGTGRRHNSAGSEKLGISAAEQSRRGGGGGVQKKNVQLAGLHKEGSGDS